MRKLEKRLQVACFALLLLLPACGLWTQVKETERFAKSRFRLRTVTETRLNKERVHGFRSPADLGFKEKLRYASVLRENPLHLRFKLNIEARNLGKERAAMNRLDWKLRVDDREWVSGRLDRRIELEPGSDPTVFPVEVDVDLRKVFSGATAVSLGKVAFKVAGLKGPPTFMTVLVRPTFLIGDAEFEFPSYLRVTTEFSDGQAEQVRKLIRKRI